MPMKLKLVKDSNPIMRKKSLPVELPLSVEDKETLDAMLEYLKLSQDEDYAKKHNMAYEEREFFKRIKKNFKNSKNG